MTTAEAASSHGLDRIERAIEDIAAGKAVVVVDDGVGFDADAALSTRRSGHLGTTLLRQIAEDAGGALRLRTTPGTGTRWELSIPAGGSTW